MAVPGGRLLFTDGAALDALPACLMNATPVASLCIPTEMAPALRADRHGYVIGCDGDCMAPDLQPGDAVLISPAMKVRPGMIVALTIKGAPGGALKRLVTALPPPLPAGGECEPAIVLQMDRPLTTMAIRAHRIDRIHAAVGVVREGRYVALAPRVVA
ncbi:MAG TPA: S24 family peptidase [Rhizomicrobium sp.]